MTITIERRISEAEQRIAQLCAEMCEAMRLEEKAAAEALDARIKAMVADCDRLRSFCG